MCFIYDNDLCLLCDLIHQILISIKQKISMVDDLKRVEALQYLRDKPFYRHFPYGHPCRCRHDQYNILTLFLYKTLYQHHSDKGLAQTYTITKKST